ASHYLENQNTWASQGQRIWLETPSGITLSPDPSKPSNLQHNIPYQKIMEQVKLFHGDVDLLIRQKEHHWIPDINPLKIHAFIQKVLTPSNPIFAEKNLFYRNNTEAFNDI